MAEEPVQRRLSAILAADMVGYSRLMEADETGTIARQKTHRSELVDPEIAAHGGRIVKTTGDGMLVEFPSVVEAVQSAINIQRAMEEREAEIAVERRIRYRIGVNIGDIVIDGDDILGDGVNIAARLEGLSEPGGICVSDVVHQSVVGKIEVTFEDLGAQQVKNITKPVHVYRAVLDQPAAFPGATTLPLPDKPSIAVLPFDNMSGDPEQEYFADGIAEDIITGLSRFHWFFVIARNSSFTYKGRSVDVTQIARELGVQYVLEGSVRKAGNRVRITAQLIDALSGRHVWADRYDRDLEDIFAVQDEITQAIVGEVAPSFISAEAKRIESKPPDNLDAWDYAMRGNWYLSRRSIDDLSEAKRLFEKALELDPKSTVALGGIAYAIGWLINFGAAGNIDEAREQGYSAARRAVDLDENNAWAHLALGIISFYRHDLEAAAAACRRAIQLNPSLAAAEGWLAIVLGWWGDYDEGIQHAEAAQRLSPHDPLYSVWSFAFTGVEFGAGNYEKSAEWARKTIEITPEFPAPWRYLTASLAHLGRIEEAEAAKDQLMRVMPHECLRLVRAALPSVEPDRMARFEGGLRKAGVPE
jgi:TolB-like protein/Tfp pilus assembly protein PilF